MTNHIKTYYGTNNNDFFQADPIEKPWKMYGKGGNDTLIGGDINDELFGEDGDDILTGDGGKNILNGGVGYDTAKETVNGNVTVTNTALTQANGYQDSLISIERVQLIGNSGSQRFDASSFTGSVDFAGAGGDDQLTGGIDRDYLSGDNGNDQLFGNNGNDKLFGGAGNDILLGQNGMDELHGNEGDDALDGDLAAFNPIFTNTNDKLFGDEGNDTLQGNYGNDTLIGGMGSDQLTGGDGNDVLMGFDTYIVNEYYQHDKLTGGAGADRFLLADDSTAPNANKFRYLDVGYATITDFNRNEGDVIQLKDSTYAFRLEQWAGNTGVKDTAIYYGGDLIGVVADVNITNMVGAISYV